MSESIDLDPRFIGVGLAVGALMGYQTVSVQDRAVKRISITALSYAGAVIGILAQISLKDPVVGLFCFGPVMAGTVASSFD